jgi:hypothetical protein
MTAIAPRRCSWTEKAMGIFIRLKKDDDHTSKARTNFGDIIITGHIHEIIDGVIQEAHGHTHEIRGHWTR